MSKIKVDLIVRAIIEKDGKIIVCRKKRKKYYFFPGGHVEAGESPEKALRREIMEELGLKIKKILFIGGSEHEFIEEGKKYQEINLAFRGEIGKARIASQEDHLEFFLFDKKQLKKETVFPEIMKKAVLRWFTNKKTFWVN